MSVFWTICTVGFCIGLGAIFSGSETAFISLNRLKLRNIKKERQKSALVIQQLLGEPERFLATMLVGTNMAVITGTVIFTGFALERFGVHHEWISPLIMIPSVLIFGEIIPKALFRQKADVLMLNLAPLLALFSKVLSPIVWLITFISERILSLFGQTKSNPKSPFVTREELKYLIQESKREGVIEPHEHSIIYSIFDFGVTKVKEIMIPLEKIASLQTTKTVNDLKEMVRKTNFSRIPLYEMEKESFVGLVNVLDFLYESDQAQTLVNFLRPLTFVSQEMVIDDALLTLRSKRQNIAIVVDDNGKNVGMVTIEDLIEEIVGKL